MPPKISMQHVKVSGMVEIDCANASRGLSLTDVIVEQWLSITGTAISELRLMGVHAWSIIFSGAFRCDIWLANVQARSHGGRGSASLMFRNVDAPSIGFHGAYCFGEVAFRNSSVNSIGLTAISAKGDPF